MTSTEQYAAVVSEARSAMEKSVELWKQGAQTFTEKADLASFMPKMDLVAGVDQYFEFAQQAMDASKDFTGKWAAAVTSLFEVLHEQTETFSALMKDQADKVSSLAVEQGEKVEKAVKKSAATAA